MRDLRDVWSGRGAPLLIAEVAQAHDGSLGMAHSYIDAAADAGADAIKFQTHIAAAESSLREPWRVKFSPEDATRYDYWKRMEFSVSQWEGLRDHAIRRGLIFLSSPFSIEAVALLNRLGLPAWKIPSGEVTNPLLLDAIIQTGKPVLLSSGMSLWSELDATAARIQQAGLPLAIFQCTSSYPTPPEETGLNLLTQIRDRYNCPVGLSDHSGQIFAPLAAAALGARLIEVHIAFSKKQFGPDAASSLTVAELATLSQGLSEISRMLSAPTDKDAAAMTRQAMRETFGQSLIVTRSLPLGHKISLSDLGSRKPGNAGIPVSRAEEICGRTLARKIPAFDFLQPQDLIGSGAP